MPGLSGVQLAQAISEQQPGLPVLLATGFSEELLGENSRRLQVVRKPYDVAMPADATAAALEAHRKTA